MSDVNQDLSHEEIVEPNDKVIDLETYEKTKNDMHKFKRQLQEEAEAKQRLEARLREIEENQLKQSENYKELWEKERQQKDEALTKYQKFSKYVIEDKKMNAIKTEALKRGIDQDFIDMLEAFDTSDVQVETTSNGNFIVNGADTWVEQLKMSKPKMFASKQDPKVNNASGNFDGREKTYSTAEILQLQKDDPAKYQDIITNKRHLIKR